MASFLTSILSATNGFIPPGILIGLSSAFVASSGKSSATEWAAWKQEFVGTFLMIGFTFSPGKWIGVASRELSLISHAIGVVMADYIGGGPHVNPAVTVCMFSLGKCDYSEAYVRICGHMAAGLLAFPIFQSFAQLLGWNELGGPEYFDDQGFGESGFWNEFFATFWLLVAIFTLNFELHFGQYHYWIKQPLTAIAIRYLIEVFSVSGPAMNPMLGTAWAVFAEGSGKFPAHSQHYMVYWAGSILGGLSATIMYVIYAGGTFLGKPFFIGPFKEQGQLAKKQD